MIIWACTRCGERQKTDVDPYYAPMHQCHGMAGMSVPFTREGAKVHMTAVEREDYVANEIVQYDGHGRPVMTIVQEYADGHTDATVYAPTAQMRGDMQ